ncbi:MAG TPA: MBL fold metallo-hydrolase [Nocardioidaceae bacterium]|jgi:glyoxylase-like metal-dependent hydrolase (beta-lactamase superfamily II)
MAVQTSYEHGRGFVEVADRVFVGRYPQWDTTVGLVVGADGLLVVDTRACRRHGVELCDDVRRVAPGLPVRWVVNTHEHFDHVMGNAAFEAATIHAHENAAARMVEACDRIKADIRADPSLDPDHPWYTSELLEAVLETEYRLPDETFSSAAAIDLGDRVVELAYPGRGHTSGDIAIRVPDVDVVFAGDLIEQSAPPSYGGDCFPLDWPATLDLVIGMLTPDTVVVPGHGTPVDKAFVQDQRADVSDIAELIRSLHGQGVPEADALAAGGDGWPWESSRLTHAVSRGYAHLR